MDLNKKQLNAYNNVEKIFTLFRKYGDKDYIGEAVSQNEHMLQAAQLASHKKMDIEAILAALFHDIGHLVSFKNEELKVNQYGVKDHEKVGAQFLRENGFEKSIIPDLVEKHVKAKKYLAFKDPTYMSRLSHASKTTLAEQGGIMTSGEAEEFEKDPHFDTVIQIRKFDELAKVVGVETIILQNYELICYDYLMSL